MTKFNFYRHSNMCDMYTQCIYYVYISYVMNLLWTTISLLSSAKQSSFPFFHSSSKYVLSNHYVLSNDAEEIQVNKTKLSALVKLTTCQVEGRPAWQPWLYWSSAQALTQMKSRYWLGHSSLRWEKLHFQAPSSFRPNSFPEVLGWDFSFLLGVIVGS